MDEFICGVVGFIMGMIIMLAACLNARESAKIVHHRNAYNEHGQLTCEICKALVEKGAK